MIRRNTKVCCFVVSALFLLIVSPRCGRYGEAFMVATAVSWRANKKEPSVAIPLLFSSADTTSESCSSIGEPDLDKVESSETKSKRALSSSFKVESYHLLWSPGAWKKLVFGSTSLFLAHGIGKFFSLATVAEGATMAAPAQGFFPLARSLATNVILPLLASACCFLQLAMNLFALGCAGFNTVLGPIRPYFISFLVYLTVISGISKHVDARHWAVMTALRWSIALLPETIHLWNIMKASYRPDRNQTGNVSSLPDLPRKLIATVQMDIPTMGCVACINGIDAALRQVSGVQYAASSLNPLGAKGGQAEVRIAADTEEEVDAVVESLAAVVARVGFPGGVVESVRVKQNRES